MVMKNERNALVYLPTGLGKTLVAAMVLKKMLHCNPERQAVFLVETNALAIQQVLYCFTLLHFTPLYSTAVHSSVL